MEQTNSSSPRYIKAKGEDRVEIFNTNIIMIKESIRIGKDQIAKIGEYNLVVELSMDRIIEVVQDMDKVIGMTLGEGISEVMQEYIKVRILEGRSIKEDIEESIGMTTIIEKEIGTGLEKDLYLDNSRRRRQE